MPQLPRRQEERRLAALGVREQAAAIAAERPHAVHENNGDETRYNADGAAAGGPAFVGSYSKGLRHDAVGDPDPVSYASLLRAVQSRDPRDFEQVLLGPVADGAGRIKLLNPQAGFAFGLEGPDPQEPTLPPAPRFDSEQAAHEMGELYWMAVLRDVPFVNWPGQVEESALQRAVTSLNTEFPRSGGTAPVTVQNLFRGLHPGEQVGPYVSQFLWKGNADPRKPVGQGRDAADGYITYGSQVIDQRQWTVVQNQNYLRGFSDWLAVQNGRDDRGGDPFEDTGQRRFIRSLRDGAHHVHFQQGINAFWNAAFLLLAEPAGVQGDGTGAGRPHVDMEFPLNPGNPYDPAGIGGGSATQAGFATFGPVHLLQLLAEAAGRAVRAVWWQKWGVHRRLRPEEFGGRVHNHVTGARTYPIHSSLTASMQGGGLGTYFRPDTGYLLPQAYPEGAPAHPAYGSGHGAVGGACATLLKAFFDESAPIENPVQATSDGLALEPYTGAGAGEMTVGGELNKLAGNLSLFRSAAGVHWRSDHTQSMALGEKVAVGLLQELSITFNEDAAEFVFTRFDGVRIRIRDGFVDLA